MTNGSSQKCTTVVVVLIKVGLKQNGGKQEGH